MVSRRQTDLSQQPTRLQVGRVSGAEEVREQEVLWCEMPGAVNCAGGGDEFVVEAGSSSEKESGSGH